MNSARAIPAMFEYELSKFAHVTERKELNEDYDRLTTSRRTTEKKLEVTQKIDCSVCSQRASLRPN
jgi:hypothetical protein